ncbi:MAG: type I-MYXAN CRISPR-associated protein Cas6/Cmx6 [Chloroflexota bacterium]|nr:type I-MYXAN CRISPR-associated protein Cas6/Cmx6 [Chloroflexota bacterium]
MDHIVDVRFGLQGSHIPADHGYHLLSAVSRVIPELHSDEEIGLHPVSGRPTGNRCITLSKASSLAIRLPVDRIKQIMPLAGKTLEIGDHKIHVGTPQTVALKPSARLYSRLVVIKGFMESDAFLEAAQRQLAGMDIKGKPFLVPQPHVAEANADKNTGSRSPYLRRTIKIRDREVVGFAMRVEELTAEESIRIQEKGLGGRRRFGCGIFIADRR